MRGKTVRYILHKHILGYLCNQQKATDQINNRLNKQQKTTDFQKQQISKTSDFKNSRFQKQQISKNRFQKTTLKKQLITKKSYLQKQQSPKNNKFQKTTISKNNKFQKTTNFNTITFP